METFLIRKIRLSDDSEIPKIMTEVMGEFDCLSEGFAIHDVEIKAMTESYDAVDSEFYVVENNGRILGFGGFAPLLGVAKNQKTAEVRKMYFSKELRGRGIGRKLLQKIIKRIKEKGFQKVYLETTEQMKAARSLYESMGFQEIYKPIGRTGHFGCDRFYRLKL